MSFQVAIILIFNLKIITIYTNNKYSKNKIIIEDSPRRLIGVSQALNYWSAVAIDSTGKHIFAGDANPDYIYTAVTRLDSSNGPTFVPTAEPTHKPTIKPTKKPVCPTRKPVYKYPSKKPTYTYPTHKQPDGKSPINKPTYKYPSKKPVGSKPTRWKISYQQAYL